MVVHPMFVMAVLLFMHSGIAFHWAYDPSGKLGFWPWIILAWGQVVASGIVLQSIFHGLFGKV